MAAAEKLNKRFHYFDSLKKLAATLTQEASGMLDTTKAFQSKLKGTMTELSQDFTPEEIDDQLGDVDFMNDFAEQLFDALDRLSKECDKTIADCIARKKRLTDALIWDKIGEEELTELAASGEAELMRQFYELAKGCTDWYSHTSAKLTQDGEDFMKTITNMSKHKYIMMNYGKEEFHAVKSSIFEIIEAMIDGQRAIEGVEKYFTGRIKFMKKRIDNETSWKYQLKYSTGVTKRCASSHTDIEAKVKAVQTENVRIAKKMGAVMAAFKEGASADLKAWDCNSMYPRPKPVDLGVPSWLGGVTKYAKKGFEVYNLVKNFIPGGSKAGKGNVPGGPKEDELMEFIELPKWDVVKEQGKGLGLKLIKDMEQSIKDESDNMAARMKIW